MRGSQGSHILCSQTFNLEIMSSLQRICKKRTEDTFYLDLLVGSVLPHFLGHLLTAFVRMCHTHVCCRQVCLFCVCCVCACVLYMCVEGRVYVHRYVLYMCVCGYVLCVYVICTCRVGLAQWLRRKELNLHCRRWGIDSWVGEDPWRRAWQSTPIFLPGESPWTEEPGGLQSMGLQRVGHDRSDSAHTHTRRVACVFMVYMCVCRYVLYVWAVCVYTGRLCCICV